jgi:hypothetical protein
MSCLYYVGNIIRSIERRLTTDHKVSLESACLVGGTQITASTLVAGQRFKYSMCYEDSFLVDTPTAQVVEDFVSRASDAISEAVKNS